MLEPIKDLQPIDDIQEIIRYLAEGKVLRVNQEDQGTILVRFNPGKHKMTEISRDIEPETFYHSRYWLPANIALNTLIAYEVYLDDDYKVYNNKFQVGELVEYQIEEDNSMDVAKVKEILVDDNKFFYKISGELSRIFHENELNKYK